MKIKCLIVDDEPLARDGLANYVKDVDFLSLEGLCESAMEADQALNSQSIDLLFLDIQMPRLNGIDFLKSLKNPPLVVLTTAYPQYALESFQLEVLDYLLKPITFERFYQTAGRARNRLFAKPPTSNTHQPVAERPSPAPDTASFFVKVDKRLERIVVADILFVESMQNYVIIHTAEEKYTALLTLRSVEETLANSLFVRIHKSYLVALNKINSIDGNQALLGQSWLPISRNYKQDLMNKILEFNDLLKKSEGSK